MAADVNLYFTGTASDAKTNITTAATTAYSGVDLHGSTATDIIREVRLTARVQGTVTGTSPTLDLKVQRSTSATTGYTDHGIAFVQITTQMLAATGGESVPPAIVLRTQPGWRYYRVFATPGGTSPVFNGLSVIGTPLDTPPY